MQNLELTFIGTGNAFAPGGLCWNGFTANRRYLFEAPPQALMSLHHVGIDPNQIDAVVLSHHHGDHFLGLPMLLLHWKHRGRTTPVTIVGPPDTEKLARQIATAVYPGIFETAYDIHWVETRPGDTVRAGDLELEPVEALHDDRLSLSLGYLARLDGRTFGYTGDTALCDGVFDLARRSEVLVSECASRADDVPVHMNLVHDIPQVRAAMAGGSPLVLTHLSPDVNVGSLSNSVVARDYQSYCF